MADTSVTLPLPSTVSSPSQLPPCAPSQLPPSIMNSFRVNAVAERLEKHIKAELDSSPSQFNDQYIDLLLSLARGIDYSISQNEIPSAVNKLPEILNEIRHRKMDDYSKACVMVLMISVRGACKAKWFSEKESQDLMSFTDEIGSCFGTLRDIDVGPTDALSAISAIFARFYPQMKMGQILGSLEVQPGRGSFIGDFQYLKSKSPSTEEKIMLFTTRLDNVETSACITTPQKVNILLNGCGVERRTNIFLDPSPQLPTDVTQMVMYGANILQAMGQFCGHYMIAVALISMSSQLESTLLKVYAPPVASTPYPVLDSDIIEEKSRISLNCSISRTRIHVPVKGQSCNHLQCFDYSNYVSMNSRRPLWHCPCCRSPVCFTDLRIDQNIAKVLKEASGDVSDVVISGDGSWEAVMETDNQIAPSTTQVTPQVSCNEVCDLTKDADEADDEMDTDENKNTKPLQHVNNQTSVVNPSTSSVSSILQSQKEKSSFAEQPNPINVSRTPEVAPEVSCSEVCDLTKDADEMYTDENGRTKPLQHVSNQTGVVNPSTLSVASNLQSQQEKSSFPELSSNLINVSRTLEVAPQVSCIEVCDLTEDADENGQTQSVTNVNNQTGVVNPSALSVASNLQSQQEKSSFAEQSNPVNVSRNPETAHNSQLQGSFQTPPGPVQHNNLQGSFPTPPGPVQHNNLQGSFPTPPGPVQSWFSSMMNCPIPYGGGSSMSSSPTAVSWFPPHATPQQRSTMPPSQFPYTITAMQGGSSFNQQLQQRTGYPFQSWNPIQNPGLVSQFRMAYMQMALNQMAAAPQRTQFPALNTSQIPLLHPRTPMGPPPGPNWTQLVRTPQPVPQATQQMPPPRFKPVTPTPSEQRENEEPVSRMRGSLTGRSYGDDISRLMIKPTASAPASGPSPQHPPNRGSNLREPPH